jgi:uncharacterized protein YjbJ (UPF0337 family)
MNREQLEGNWKQLKGHVQEKWGKLTADDLDEIQGRQQILVGKIQERYGSEIEEARKQVETWMTQQDERP